MADDLEWGFTTDLPEIEEDPVFDNTSPLFSSLKPVFNRNFLPRFEGSDPDTKGSSRPWTCLRINRKLEEEDTEKPKFGLSYPPPPPGQDPPIIRKGRIIKMPNNIWDRLAHPKPPKKSIKLRKSDYTVGTIPNSIPTYTKVYQRIEAVKCNDEEYDKLNKKLKALNPIKNSTIIKKRLEEVDNNYYSPEEVEKRRQVEVDKRKYRMKCAIVKAKYHLVENYNHRDNDMQRWERRRTMLKLETERVARQKVLMEFFACMEFFRICHTKRLTERERVKAKLKLVSVCKSIQYCFKRKEEIRNGRIFRQHVIRIRKLAVKAIERRRKNRRKHASNIIQSFLIANNKMNDFAKIISNFSFHVKLLQQHIRRWCRRMEAKEYMMGLLWDQYEATLLKKYNQPKPPERKSISYGRRTVSIVLHDLNAIKIHKIPEDIKRVMVLKFLREIREENYLQCKTNKDYRKYEATPNDVYDIFTSDIENLINISKKLVTIPKYQHKKAYIFTAAHRKVGGLKEYVEKAIVITANRIQEQQKQQKESTEQSLASNLSVETDFSTGSSNNNANVK